MNLKTIRAETQRLLAQANINAAFMTVADLNAYINEGEKDICIKTGAYVIPIGLNTTATQTYTLPWNVINIDAVLRGDGVSLNRMTPADIGRIFNLSGVPIHYMPYIVPITLETWATGQRYVVWAGTAIHTYIIPSIPNGYMYETIIAGTSDGTEPTWPIVIGQTIIDGGVTWQTRELVASLKAIILDSAPSAAYQGVWQVWVSSMANGLVLDTDAPVIPLDKHQTLVFYAAYKAAVEMKQTQAATAFYGMYATGVGLPIAGGK